MKKNELRDFLMYESGVAFLTLSAWVVMDMLVKYPVSTAWFLIPLFFALIPFVLVFIKYVLTGSKMTIRLFTYRLVKIAIGLGLLILLLERDPEAIFSTGCLFVLFYFVLTPIETVNFLRLVKK